MSARVVTCDGCGRDARVNNDVRGSNFCADCCPGLAREPHHFRTPVPMNGHARRANEGALRPERERPPK